MIHKILQTGLLVSALAIPGTALAAIAGSAHDFSGGGGNVCSGCHTPHNALASTSGPLWNAAASNGTYSMYDSPSINMVTDTVPNGVSAACLSCHDGVLGVVGAGSGKNLGEDLTNDHPISIAYDNAADSGFVQLNQLNAGLKLYGNKVECATCHDVHATDVVGKLERNLGGQDICTACHIK